MEAQIQLAPQLYASEAKYRPQYADLERRMQLEQMGIDPSKGLLQAYEEDFAPSMARQKAATVKGDIDILREYGPQLLQAQRDIDPLADSLRQGIMDSASEDLAAGQGLTETEQRDLDQQILSGAADRGMEGQGSTFADMVSQRLSCKSWSQTTTITKCISGICNECNRSTICINRQSGIHSKSSNATIWICRIRT